MFLKRKITLLMLLLCLSALGAMAQGRTRMAGGDLSLLAAYEKAGDSWKDAKGNRITDLLKYVKEVAGWNSVRVRLFVNPDADGILATCQDLNYVKALGKRIKDSGMAFLLDIHYSDTWGDVSHQAIPAEWGMNAQTATDVMAARVYDYTTEVLTALNSCGATPDAVQVGNEISYGMLWDNATYSGTGISMGSTSNQVFSWYNTYNGTTWKRLAAIVSSGCKAVRKICPKARVVIHTERTNNEGNQAVNFYHFLQNAGLDTDDWDIIGLSYYPFWHGDMGSLELSLQALQQAFPRKEIQIVETAWLNGKATYPADAKYDITTWERSPAGQHAFITDLQATLRRFEHVTGLYYWAPEECGNGANSSGNRVMDSWDGRGFWDISWKSASHALLSNDALMCIRDFATAYDDSFIHHATDRLNGDMNGDGRISMTDANILVNICLGK